MSKNPFRHRRKLSEKEIPEIYPDSLAPKADLASNVQYVGSQEHKRYPSFAGPPAFRHDATPCPPEWGKDEAARNTFEQHLKQAIHAECVSAADENGYPRYVWGFFQEQLCIARLINQEQGWYKAWCIEDFERPRDPAGKLETLQQGQSNA